MSPLRLCNTRNNTNIRPYSFKSLFCFLNPPFCFILVLKWSYLHHYPSFTYCDIEARNKVLYVYEASERESREEVYIQTLKHTSTPVTCFLHGVFFSRSAYHPEWYNFFTIQCFLHETERFPHASLGLHDTIHTPFILFKRNALTHKQSVYGLFFLGFCLFFAYLFFH